MVRRFAFGICVLIIVSTFSLAVNAGEKVFCLLCGAELEGDYIRFKDGDTFCKACMEKDKCIQCGKPTDNKVDGKALCVKCAENPNECRFCGMLLGRKYIKFPLSEGKFCQDCVDKYPKCRFCSAPTKEHSGGSADWVMCQECKNRAISGVSEIKRMLSEVEVIIQSNIHLSLNTPAALEVCVDIVKEGRGMNGDEMGLMQQRGGNLVLLIQDGLPLEVMYETLAHEWAHAWVAQNARYKVSLTNEEGFCQWVASKILLEKDFDKSLSILRNRDDLYGSGYRKIEKIELSRGVDGVVEYIINSKPGLFKRIFGSKR